MRALVLVLFAVTTFGCQCGDNGLVRTYTPSDDAGVGGGSTGGGSAAGGGTATGGGTTSTGGGSATGGGPGWCASDCDCPATQRCVTINGGELTSNSCMDGPGNTCTTQCPVTCGSGTQCMGGTCVTTPCVGTNCTSMFAVSVQGTYQTYYELDIHDFASQAADIGNLLTILGALLNGQGANCSAQTSPQSQLMCIVVDLIAMNIHAPPWVSQLITVLGDAFKFGNQPIKAKGVMTLAEQGTTLYAAETWSEMWLNYGGQTLNVINSPVLGANGNITVTVEAFGGTRSATAVDLGPRDISFDVNKLLVNLINVVISAASNNQAHDVGSLISLVLCDNIPQTGANSAVTIATCHAAAQQLANQFQLNSGLGGVHLDHQTATIYDLNGDNIADALGLPNARGAATGDMSNGLISGGLGAFPATSWYGTK
jgi:hypothetical protein